MQLPYILLGLSVALNLVVFAFVWRLLRHQQSVISHLVSSAVYHYRNRQDEADRHLTYAYNEWCDNEKDHMDVHGLAPRTTNRAPHGISSEPARLEGSWIDRQ